MFFVELRGIDLQDGKIQCAIEKFVDKGMFVDLLQVYRRFCFSKLDLTEETQQKIDAGEGVAGNGELFRRFLCVSGDGTDKCDLIEDLMRKVQCVFSGWCKLNTFVAAGEQGAMEFFFQRAQTGTEGRLC